jgi:hypothetical protein
MIPAVMEENEKDLKQHYDGPLVIVKRFRGLPEAFVAKSILDSAEIDSYFTDEKVVGMVYPNLIGTIKLMVRPEDLDTAVELLSQQPEEPIEEVAEDGADFSTMLRKLGHRDDPGDERK